MSQIVSGNRPVATLFTAQLSEAAGALGLGRTYDADTCKNQRKALGSYSELKGHEIFAAARKDADAWSNQVENGSVRAGKIETVADPRRAFFKEKPGPIAAGVFRRQIFSDPIAEVKIDTLRRRHVKD